MLLLLLAIVSCQECFALVVMVHTLADGTQVFCTAAGVVGAARESGKVRVIYREPTAAVEALCLGSAGPCREVFCATDQEALVFLANVL